MQHSMASCLAFESPQPNPVDRPALRCSALPVQAADPTGLHSSCPDLGSHPFKLAFLPRSIDSNGLPPSEQEIFKRGRSPCRGSRHTYAIGGIQVFLPATKSYEFVRGRHGSREFSGRIIGLPGTLQALKRVPSPPQKIKNERERENSMARQGKEEKTT